MSCFCLIAKFSLKEKGDKSCGVGKVYYLKPGKSLSNVENSGGAHMLPKCFHQQFTPSFCGNKSYSAWYMKA